MPYKHIEDRRESRRRWYRNNKEKEMKKARERERKIAEWYINYKLKLGCSQCGENHPACIEFHHKDPIKKDDDISMLVHDGCSIETIKKEIDKCIVLCSNCHRKFHYKVPVI